MFSANVNSVKIKQRQQQRNNGKRKKTNNGSDANLTNGDQQRHLCEIKRVGDNDNKAFSENK